MANCDRLNIVRSSLLALLSALAICQAPSTATEGPGALNGQTEHAVISPHHDGDGRQIAAVIAVPASPHIAPKSTAKPVAVRALSVNGTASRRWQKITISVPTTVAGAADFCGSAANRFGRIAAEKVLQASTWLNAFIKQMTSAPTITPATPVYESVPAKTFLSAQPVRYNNKAWYMPDGRVKTLVQR